MTFAYLIMGDFDSQTDRASICGGTAQIIGVSGMEDAIAVARELQEQGISCIELCGGFGPDKAKELIEATDCKIPIGYAVHLPEQDGLYEAVFSK